MLTIQKVDSRNVECTPNIVPCRIHYTGPTKVTKRYWNPSKDNDGLSTAFFRGRKLRGRTVKLPEQYQGLILKTTNKTLSKPNVPIPVPHFAEDDDEDDLDSEEHEDTLEAVHILENISTFNEFVVWGHDQAPDLGDSFVKNIAESISFAEAIHGSSHGHLTTSNTNVSSNTADKIA